mgnify:FL=1|jgi:hypothetical protein
MLLITDGCAVKCGVKYALLAKCILRLYFMDGRTFYDVQITEVQMAAP